MQVKLFTIPINNIDNYNEELNKFLRTHKVIEVDKHLVQNGVSYNWCFYISYIGEIQDKYSSKKKIDYMNVLDKETFAVFSKLRQIRKQDDYDQSDDNSSCPSDEVSGYNLHQIQSSLDNCRDIDCWENNLRDNYINSTEENLDKLFNYVRFVRNNNLTHPCY